MPGARGRVARPGAGADEEQRAPDEQRGVDARARGPAKREAADDQPTTRENSQRAGPDVGRGQQLTRVPVGFAAQRGNDDPERKTLGERDTRSAEREQEPHAPDGDRRRLGARSSRPEDDERKGHPADRDRLTREVEPAEQNVSERGHGVGTTG